MAQIGDAKVITVKGTYKYVGDDGKIYVVNYTADEKGYVADVKPAI